MKILVATDGSQFSDSAIDRAAEMIVRPDTSEIMVLSVYEKLGPIAGEPFGVSIEYYQQAENAARSLADEAIKHSADRLRARFPGTNLNMVTKLERGNAARVIVEVAEEWKADVIIVGTHGHGFWERNLLGSVSDSVVHHAHCTVLVVRSEQAAE